MAHDEDPPGFWREFTLEELRDETHLDWLIARAAAGSPDAFRFLMSWGTDELRRFFDHSSAAPKLPPPSALVGFVTTTLEKIGSGKKSGRRAVQPPMDARSTRLSHLSI